MIPTRFSAMLLLSGTLFLLSGCGRSVTVVDADSSAEVDLVEFPEPPNAEELLAGAWVLPDGGILTFSTAEKPESDEPDFGLKYQGTYTSSAGENAEFQWQFGQLGLLPSQTAQSNILKTAFQFSVTMTLSCHGQTQ